MTRPVRWLCVSAILLLVVGCSGGPNPIVSGLTGDTPSQGAKPAIAHAVPTVLILDASGSMTENDAPGPRIDAARAAAKGLVAALPDDAELGLATYGTGTDSSDAAAAAGCRDVTVLAPLARLDRAGLNAKIDALRPSGYTPISLALENATGLLPADSSQQAIVLVSDGEDTCGRPPCDVAVALHKQHPGLAISTVGFRTDGPAVEQLSCIANATGGVFVQAANANQLAARLLATRDVQAAKSALSSSGSGGIELGSRIGDIRAAHNDFPDAATSGRVIVEWRDCDFTFVDGALDAIAPHDGGHTIDGISSGSKVSDAVQLYGKPLGDVEKESGKDWLTFLADEANGTAYRMSVDGYSSSTGAGQSGTIDRIVLCRCRPHDNRQMTVGTVSFRVPDGWQPRPSSGGTLTAPLVELAPSADATTSIAIWYTDVAQDSKASLDAVRQSGGGEMSTFGGKQVWTYGVNHTVSSRDSNKYGGHWYYYFEGNNRADIWCDAVDDKDSQQALMPICEKFVASVTFAARAAAPAPPARPVAGFDGYGPVKIGMTKDEAMASMGGQVAERDAHSCIVLKRDSLKVTLTDDPRRVAQIQSPQGATTDRGVGNGSTAQQIKDAYSGSEFLVEDMATQAGPTITVKDGAGRMISFGLSDGHADPPTIGQPAGFELCSG